MSFPLSLQVRRLPQLGCLACLVVLLAAGAPVHAEDWRLARDEEGIRVYLSPVPGSKYSSYRGVVEIDADLRTLVDLQENLRVACKWIYACTQLRLLKYADDTVWLYMQTQLPWPARPRDVVLRVDTRRTADGGLERHLTAEPGYLPAVPGQIRVPQLDGLWQMTPLGNGHTRVLYQMRGEPGGSVPSWLANRFVVDAPLVTLRTLRAVAERQPRPAPQ